MIVALVLLFSANCFIAAANNSNGNEEAVTSGSASIEDISDENSSRTSPIEISSNCPDTCNCNATLTCDDSEVLDECPTYCPSDFCPTGERQNQKCSQPNPCPKPACKCRFNYRRATNGKCIPTRDCPPFQCSKPNEEYNPCPPLCPNGNCSQATPTGKCPLPGRIGIVLECNPSCRCKEGYWRNDDGNCVPYNQCPGKETCAPGDILDTCPLFCNTDYCPKNEDDIRICAIPIVCMKPACKCPFNQLRAANGTCIPASKCPPIKCTRPHEVYNSCPPACPSDDCSEATPTGKCPKPGRIDVVVPCQPGCRCKKGYWRKNGICVPFAQCNKDKRCPFPNEEYTDSKKKCPSDLCSSVLVRCIPSTEGSPGCVCSSGYLRPKPGVPCVPSCQCSELKNTEECKNPKVVNLET